MKTIILTALGFVLCAITFLSCSKNTGYGNAISCTATQPLVITDNSSGYIMALPTAFTPNDDGLNDHMRAIYYRMDTTGYQLTIRLGGQVLFQTNSVSAGWDGHYAGGVPAPEGKYQVDVRFRGPAGNLIDTCNVVTLLKYDMAKHCLETHGRVYHFENDFDPAGCFRAGCAEPICP